ncbi:MAG: dihydrodipicolinate synthase family protein [Anaerolineae bacterium]|nr:dihydrodipicolinate synthase family protein [Anaerolineae bacterium]
MNTYGGAWPTMVTPFDFNLKIDLGAYRAMIEWYVEHGVGGLYANCLSSEMYLLDNDERLTLVREAVRTADGRVPVAATGNLGETVEAHIALCRQVADVGADVVMLVVPELCDDDADLERYYLTLAGQVDAPLGLYECPVPRSYHLGVDLVRTLAQSGRFVAYKETSCDLTKIAALLAVTQDTPLALLQANTPYLLDVIRAGAPGTMGIAAIWLPDLVAAVIDKGRAGDPDAERLQAHLCALELAQRVVHPQGSKYLLGKRGVPISTRSRHPRSPLTPEVLHALDYCATQWFDAAGQLRRLEG